MKLVPSEASETASGPQTERSDDVLMALAAQDRSAAFVELTHRYEAKLRAFCGMLVKDDTLGRDLAQDVLLNVWRTRARYQARGKFKQLLFMMARNQCRAALRKRRLRRLLGLEDSEGEDGLPDVSSGPTLSEQMLDDERQLLIRRALEQLPEKFRLPLMLRFCEEMPYDEIAAIIGRTESATRSRVHYGLKALEEILPPEVLS